MSKENDSLNNNSLSENQQKSKTEKSDNSIDFNYHTQTKSNSNKVPYFALIFFLSVFTLTILFIMGPFFGITEISIFGLVLVPHDVYINLLNAIITRNDIRNFYKSNPLAIFAVIAQIPIIFGVF